MTDRPFAIVDM
jgi:hypothetical protein